MNKTRRAVYHGRIHPQLMGKTACVRPSLPDRGEPEGLLMAAFDDWQAFGLRWYPMLPSEMTLYPESEVVP